MESKNRNGYFAFKMEQAREAYNEAQGLLEDDAELRYVMNSLYYAYYYPVLALLQAAGSGAAMQSVSIALFEKRFSGSGIIDYRFFPAIRKAFELKPKCTDAVPRFIDRAAVDTLFQDAQDFYHAVETAEHRVATP